MGQDEMRITHIYPLFSVVVLTYFQRHLLNDCINSILEQDYPNIELIICDDCSPDFDCSEVEEYISNYIKENKKNNIANIVIFQQEKNVGITANAQKGIELSSGIYLKIHSGDDMLYGRNVLTRIFREFFKPDVMIVAGRSIDCMPDGEMTSHIGPSEHKVVKMQKSSAEKQFELMTSRVVSDCIRVETIFWKREFFDKMGGIDLNFRYLYIWPLLLKATAFGQRIVSLDFITTIYRYGGFFNRCNSLNLMVTKQYYREYIQLFEQIAIPFFKNKKKNRKIARCAQCIRCIKARIDIDGEWFNWSFWKKAAWKIKNLKHLILSWIYKVRSQGVSINRKMQLMAMLACLFLYYFKVEVWPGVRPEKVWIVVFVIAFVWLTIQEFGYRVIQCVNKLLNFMKG